MVIKRMAVLLIAIFLFWQVHISYALDWINLHEKADSSTLKEAQDALNKEPDSIAALYVLGLVYLNLHQDAQAEGAFRKILSLEPKSAEAQWGLAEVLRRQHKLDTAEEALTKVIKTTPEFIPAHISLAYLKYTRMDFERSAKIAYKVIKKGRDKADLSNYVRAYLIFAGAKGMIAHYGGPISKLFNGTVVLANLKKAERLNPHSADVLLGLGSFYLLAPTIGGGNIEKARLYLEEAVRVDPLLADAYVRLAHVYKNKGEKDKYLNKALEIDPANELALDIKSGRCNFICAAER